MSAFCFIQIISPEGVSSYFNRNEIERVSGRRTPVQRPVFGTPYCTNTFRFQSNEYEYEKSYLGELNTEVWHRYTLQPYGEPGRRSVKMKNGEVLEVTTVERAEAERAWSDEGNEEAIRNFFQAQYNKVFSSGNVGHTEILMKSGRTYVAAINLNGFLKVLQKR